MKEKEVVLLRILFAVSILITLYVTVSFRMHGNDSGPKLSALEKSIEISNLIKYQHLEKNAFELLAFSEKEITDISKNENYKILIVYNTLICRKCLTQELSLINQKYLNNKKNIKFIPVAAYTDENEIIEIKEYYLLRNMKFQNIVKRRQVIDEFLGVNSFLQNMLKGFYIDTPIFFLINSKGIIVDVHKPLKFETKYLDMWLSSVIE